jgi:membrane-anchored glycerophosphoryl diester phosphodiesterase (GDPDase)
MALVLGLVWVVLYVAFGFWLYARYALSVPAALAENLSITGSVRRSVELSRGSKGRLYAMLLSIVGAYMVVDSVLVPVELMAFNPFHPHPTGIVAMGPGLLVLSSVIGLVSIVISALVMVFIGIATALCYYDLRVRKEGFGVVTPPPPEVPVAPAEPWAFPPNEPTGDLPIS